MNKNLQNIDKVFLQHLDNYKEEPPEDAWNTIENELNKNEAALYKSKYLWLKKILVCAGFIIAFLMLSNTLQPVLNKPEHIHADNYREETLANESAINNTSITPRKMPVYTQSCKAFYSKEKIDDDNLKSFSKADTSVSIITLQMANHKPQSVADEHLKLVNSSAEDFVKVAPQDYLQINDKKQNQPVNRANKKSSVHINQKNVFYIIPYFSIDHVTGRIKKTAQTVTSNFPQFEKERLDLAWTTGVLVEKELSPRISVQSGLLYSYWTNRISPAIVKALQDDSGDYKFKLSTNYGYAELKLGIAQSGDSAVVTNGNVKLQSLSVPVTAVINLKTGRLKINAVAGGSLNCITGDVAEIEYNFANNIEKDYVQKLEGLRKTYLTAVLGADANYDINKRISVGVNPEVRYAITPVNKNTLLKTYPVSLGAGAFVRIKL